MKIDRVSGSSGPATVKIKSSAAGTPAANNTSDYTDVDTLISFVDGESTKTFQ